MTKLVGQGGTLTKNAGSVSNVVSMAFTEDQGTVYGSNQGSLKVEVILDSGTVPERHMNTGDFVVVPNGASWSITLTNSRVMNPSFDIKSDQVITQTYTLESDNITIA